MIRIKSHKAAQAKANRKKKTFDASLSSYITKFHSETITMGFKEMFFEQENGIESLLTVVPIFLSKEKGSDEETQQARQDRLRRLYSELDRDGDNAITPTEMRAAMSTMNVNMTIQEIETLFHEGDADGDGHLSFEEFEDLMDKALEKKASKKRKPSRLDLTALQTFGAAQMGKRVVSGAKTISSSLRCADMYDCFANFSQKCATHPMFERIVVICIFLVGIATMVQLEFIEEDDADSSQSLHQQRLATFLDVAQALTLTVFTAEVVVKIAAEGREPLRFFTDQDDGAFNTFDFFVVAISYAFLLGRLNGGSFITVLRLLRLLKIATRIPELRCILLGLFAGITAVGSILILLTLVTYLFAIVGVLLFGVNDPGHFGSVGQAMLTLFQCATLASWRDIFWVNYFGCNKFDMDVYTETARPVKIHTAFGWFYGFGCSMPEGNRRALATIFFVCFTVLTAFVILSLFISVITMAMFEIMEIKAHQKKMKNTYMDGEMPTEKRRAMHDAFMDETTTLGEALDSVFDSAEMAYERELNNWCHLVRDRCRDLASSPAFQAFVVSAILLTGILEGIETDNVVGQRLQGHTTVNETLWIAHINDAILVLFTVELAVNFIAVSQPRVFFADGWNVFDALVVGLTYLSMFTNISSVTVLRLLRLLRVVRLLHSFPTLQTVAQSLINAFKDVGFVMLMILVINFIFAAIGMILFQKNDPQNFGTLNLAMMTIWQMETLDGWEDVMMINMLGCSNYGYWDRISAGVNDTNTMTSAVHLDPFWKIDQMAFLCHPEHSQGLGWIAVAFSFCVILLGGMVLPTVLIGVISLGFDRATIKIKDAGKETKVLQHILEHVGKWPDGHVTEQQMEDLRTIFSAIDFNMRGDISHDEFVPFLEMLCERFGLRGFEDGLLNEMFHVVDVSGNGTLSFPEFVWLMLFLKHNEKPHDEVPKAKKLTIPPPDADSKIDDDEVEDDANFGEEAKIEQIEQPVPRSVVQTAQLICEASTALLDARIGSGLDDDETDPDGYDSERAGNDAADDFDPGCALCATSYPTQVTANQCGIEGDGAHIDDAAHQELMDVLRPLASLASGLQPAADRVSNTRARADVLLLLEKLMVLPTVPQEEVLDRLKPAAPVIQTSYLSQPPASVKKHKRRAKQSKTHTAKRAVEASLKGAETATKAPSVSS